MLTTEVWLLQRYTGEVNCSAGSIYKVTITGCHQKNKSVYLKGYVTLCLSPKPHLTEKLVLP